MEKDKLIKMLIGFLPLLLLFLDPPEGMDPKAWGLFPFYAGAILILKVVQNRHDTQVKMTF